jgi:hypothetical protein
MNASATTSTAFPRTIVEDVGKLKSADPRAWDRFYRTYERYIIAIAARCGVKEHRRPEVLNAVLVKVWSLCRGFDYRETDDGMEFTVVNPLRQEVWQQWSRRLGEQARADAVLHCSEVQRLTWRQRIQGAMQEEIATFVRALPPEIAGENAAMKVAQHLSDLLSEAAAGTLPENALLPNRYAKFRYWLAAVVENESRHGSRLSAWEKRIQSLDSAEEQGHSLIEEIAGEQPAARQNFDAARSILESALDLARTRYRSPNKDLHLAWFLQRKLDGVSTRELAAAHPPFSEATINQAISTVQQIVKDCAAELASSGRY